MTFTSIFIVAGVILFLIFILIARLAVRWVVRLTIMAVILVALIAGGFFWWWTTRLAPTPSPKSRTTPSRRTSP
ncbi:MAG TPA: hypothetical protein VJ023_17085 [Pyrinomonadaceae bacterium]|nr:hypothetical protein [Pyrinomonadaceae bacterium]